MGKRHGAIFEHEGQLWLNPSLLVEADNLDVDTLEPFEIFQYRGEAYELWGNCPNGLLWIGRFTTTDLDDLEVVQR